MSPEPAHVGSESSDPTGRAASASTAYLPSLESLLRILEGELLSSQQPSVAEASAQLIRFAAGEAVFAMAADQLSEIDNVPAITFVPWAPASVRGLANLRGEVIVVVDLRRFLAISSSKSYHRNETERMIVLRDGGRGRPCGVLVDRVFGISAYHPNSLRRSAKNVPDALTDFVTGSVDLDGETIPMVDLQRIAADATSWSQETGR